MNILILAAGENEYDKTDPYPIWLSELDGQIMLERQIDSLRRLNPRRFLVCVRAEDNAAHYVSDILSMISSDADVIAIKRNTAGAACTALLAIDKINVDEELIIVNATDQLNIDTDQVVSEFRNSGCDGGIVTFESLHPRYSYVRTNSNGNIFEVAEKRPISREACAGFYWLRNAGAFFDALKSMILKDAHVAGRFYVAPALNEMILQQKIIKTFKIDKSLYLPIKSAKQLNHYETIHEEGSLS